MSLLTEMNQRALRLGVPITAHLDITYRCNERCEHCYLDHEDKGEMTTDEIKDVLEQLAKCGVFFLVVSGGEPLMRRDCFEIISHARKLLFNVKLKTNAVMIREREAVRLTELGVEQIQVSIYSHRPEVHDSITKLPGSLKRTIAAIRFMKSQGLKVCIANVLMLQNIGDYEGVLALAEELGVSYTLDPTITPKIDGDAGITSMRITGELLGKVFKNQEVVGNVDEFCAIPGLVGESELAGIPCSAGHSACYISPYGDVYPCVQFPLPCGNLRQKSFRDIWYESEQLKSVRAIRGRDLHTCSSCSHLGSCSRCPGLAYMEGDMRGPSTADCQKSFVRTGMPTAGMTVSQASYGRQLGLIQIKNAAERAV